MKDADRAAYVEFVTSRLPALRRLAFGVCGDRDQVDDLVQIVLAQAYQKWSHLQAAENMDRYLRGMLVNAFLNERRRPWRRLLLFAVAPANADTVAGADAGVDDRTVLWQAIGRLPPKQRAVVVLRFACDMSISEAAHALHCSPGTVKSQTHEALVSLRQRLADLSFPHVQRP